MRHHRQFSRQPILLAALWLSVAGSIASAQTGPFVDIHTDRDAFTPSTFTAGPASVITEGSWVYIDNGPNPPTNSYPELLVRSGATNRFEWRFGAGYVDNAGGYLVTNAEGGDGRHDGTTAHESNILYGFKAIVTEERDWLPRSCVIMEAFTPMSGDVSGTVPVATYALGWQLPNRWRLDAAMRYSYGQGQDQWFSKWAPSVVLRIPVTERWEVHAEYFSSSTTGLPDNETSPFFSPGTHYLLTHNLEIGIRIGWGLNDDAAAFFSDAGFGWRF